MFKKDTFIIKMADRLSNTELKRLNNKFVSLLLRFLTALNLSSSMQASLCDIRFVVNRGDRSVHCFNWKTSLKKSVFSALASKLNTVFFFHRKFTCSMSGHRPQTITSDKFLSECMTRALIHVVSKGWHVHVLRPCYTSQFSQQLVSQWLKI